MAQTPLLTLALIALFALPLAAAQDYGNDTTPNVNVNVTDNRDPASESTFAGMSTTVVIILIVLAVLVVALIVAMASRP